MCFEDLDKLIRELKEKHTEICDRWSKHTEPPFNLDKTYPADIIEENSNKEFLEYIFQYREFLATNMTDYSISLLSRNLEYRIKTKNSIEEKLAKYKEKKSIETNSKGKFPLKKCLNDLYGARYFFEGKGLPLEEIEKHLKSTFPDFKIKDASNGEYKAVHVYFQKDNFSFPWELQVWNQKDAALNKKSHKEHKQDYTKWEKESLEEK